MFRIVASMCLLVLFAWATPAAGPADVIFVGASVLTADASRPTVEAIAIESERIAAVGPEKEVRRLAGPKTRIISLHGRTIIPGLMDAHVHLLGLPTIVDEPSLRDHERTVVPNMMAGFLRHGVTTIRSTADPLPYIAQLRDRLERRELIGPRLLITGPTPCSPGGHPATTVCRNNPFCRQGLAREPEDEEQARQVVRELVRAKVDVVKVTLDPLLGKVPMFSDAVVTALVDETHRNGLRIIAHAPVTKHYAEIGFDEFVHLARLGDPAQAVQVATLLVERKIPLTTTLSFFDAYKDTAGRERVLGFPSTPRLLRTFEDGIKMVRVFANAGVKLVVGTDWAPPVGPGWAQTDDVRLNDPRILAGAMTLHEMELLRRAGLSTPAVLAAATSNAAEALGIIHKVGTIAEGKLADLVILDGDLLQDFSALRRTLAVLKSGRVVHGTLPSR